MKHLYLLILLVLPLCLGATPTYQLNNNNVDKDLLLWAQEILDNAIKNMPEGNYVFTMTQDNDAIKVTYEAAPHNLKNNFVVNNAWEQLDTQLEKMLQQIVVDINSSISTTSKKNHAKEASIVQTTMIEKTVVKKEEGKQNIKTHPTIALTKKNSINSCPRAIGLNLGYGMDLSYQHSLSEANMIDLSVNIPAFSGIGVTATYDWINPFGSAIPWYNKGDWNWYLGVGAGGGVYDFHFLAWYVGAVGHIGVEYNFWFPLQLSVDWRPNLGLVGEPYYGSIGWNTSGLYSGISLGVRYLF